MPAPALLRWLPPGAEHLRRGLYARGAGFLVAYGAALAVFLNPDNYAQSPAPWALAAAGVAVTAGLGLYGWFDLAKEAPRGEPGRGGPSLRDGGRPGKKTGGR